MPKDPEAHKAYCKAYYAANKAARAAKYAASGKAWYDANKDRKSATHRAWREANLAGLTARSARRRAALISATPPWQCPKELDEIWMGCPEGHHVDHIHPLNGMLSCGLNVSWNLQYLLAEDNLAKSNKMPPPGYLDWFGHDKEHSVWPHP